jgi:hypothetical protein
LNTKEIDLTSVQLASQGPVDIAFVMWRKEKRDDEDNEKQEDNEDEDDDKPEPGSLQYILDGIETERVNAVNEAINARMKEKGYFASSDFPPIRDEVSVPFENRVEEARKKVVEAKTMTAEEAKAIIGVDDARRKEKSRVKKNLQNKMNEIQKERNKAVHEALNTDAKHGLTAEEAQARIAKAEKPFLERMEKSRGYMVEYGRLTREEADAIVPNPNLDDWERDLLKKKAAAEAKEAAKRAKKEAELAAFKAPRVVTDQGFPVSKAGMQK